MVTLSTWGSMKNMRDTPGATTNPQRGAYHHGDLRNALSDAALALARVGGPEAVVLREAARRAGVSATAAYRHFAKHADLVEEVKHRALAELARAMEAALTAADAKATAIGATPQERARRRLHAVGRGYLNFAQGQPGLFRTAFCRTEAEASAAAAIATAGSIGNEPDLEE